MTDIKELAKYLYSVGKLTEDEASAVATIEGCLRELSNAQITLAQAVVSAVGAEWGDTARTSKFTCADINKKLTEHLKK